MPEEEWPPDALTRFLATAVDGERLTPRHIKAQIMFMIGAGSETTRNTIGNLFFRLGLDPSAYGALRADRSLLDHVIEETLRIDPPAQWMVRTCTQPTDVGGRPIEPGQKVFMCIGSGNRDERVHDAPDMFRIDRTSHDHLAFGSGPHVCPGAPLARMEIRAAVRAFLDRVRSYRLVAPDHYDAMPTAMLQGPRTLRIVVDPAPEP
jgi:cytochrome P450